MAEIDLKESNTEKVEEETSDVAEEVTVATYHKHDGEEEGQESDSESRDFVDAVEAPLEVEGATIGFNATAADEEVLAHTAPTSFSSPSFSDSPTLQLPANLARDRLRDASPISSPLISGTPVTTLDPLTSCGALASSSTGPAFATLSGSTPEASTLPVFEASAPYTLQSPTIISRPLRSGIRPSTPSESDEQPATPSAPRLGLVTRSRAVLVAPAGVKAEGIPNLICSRLPGRFQDFVIPPLRPTRAATTKSASTQTIAASADLAQQQIKSSSSSSEASPPVEKRQSAMRAKERVAQTYKDAFGMKARENDLRADSRSAPSASAKASTSTPRVKREQRNVELGTRSSAAARAQAMVSAQIWLAEQQAAAAHAQAAKAAKLKAKKEQEEKLKSDREEKAKKEKEKRLLKARQQQEAFVASKKDSGSKAASNEDGERYVNSIRASLARASLTPILGTCEVVRASTADIANAATSSAGGTTDGPAAATTSATKGPSRAMQESRAETPSSSSEIITPPLPNCTTDVVRLINGAAPRIETAAGEEASALATASTLNTAQSNTSSVAGPATPAMTTRAYLDLGTSTLSSRSLPTSRSAGQRTSPRTKAATHVDTDTVPFLTTEQSSKYTFIETHFLLPPTSPFPTAREVIEIVDTDSEPPKKSRGRPRKRAASNATVELRRSRRRTSGPSQEGTRSHEASEKAELALPPNADDSSDDGFVVVEAEDTDGASSYVDIDREARHRAGGSVRGSTSKRGRGGLGRGRRSTLTRVRSLPTPSSRVVRNTFSIDNTPPPSALRRNSAISLHQTPSQQFPASTQLPISTQPFPFATLPSPTAFSPLYPTQLPQPPPTLSATQLCTNASLTAQQRITSNLEVLTQSLSESSTAWGRAQQAYDLITHDLATQGVRSSGAGGRINDYARVLAQWVRWANVNALAIQNAVAEGREEVPMTETPEVRGRRGERRREGGALTQT